MGGTERRGRPGRPLPEGAGRRPPGGRAIARDRATIGPRAPRRRLTLPSARANGLLRVERRLPCPDPQPSGRTERAGVSDIPIDFSATDLWLVNIAIALMMFGVSLGLTVDDFRRVREIPRAPVSGLVAQ